MQYAAFLGNQTLGTLFMQTSIKAGKKYVPNIKTFFSRCGLSEAKP